MTSKFLISVIVEKCHFDIAVHGFLQPPISPFIKGESDDDLTYSPLCRLTRVGFFEGFGHKAGFDKESDPKFPLNKGGYRGLS